MVQAVGPAYLFDSNRFESIQIDSCPLNRFREFSLNRFTSTKFQRFLIDYNYFYTRIVISCDQRSVKQLNFQNNIKITTYFKSKTL